MSAQPAWWKSTEAMVAAILLLAMVLIGLVNPAFWSLENLFSLARSNIVIGIIGAVAPEEFSDEVAGTTPIRLPEMDVPEVATNRTRRA